MRHVSKEIIATKSTKLRGKTVLLGVTSSAALYKSIDLARELMRHGAEVHVIMSPTASKLISPELFKWATGNDVLVELTGDIEHIALTHHDPKNTILIIAPATANTIAKLSLGIADNALLTLALSAMGMNIPTIIVPAMHLSLWQSPQVQRAVRSLREMNVEILEPLISENKAKYPDVTEIVEYVFRIVASKTLKGKRVLVTAGATRIYIDPIRFISNPSSGKMGVAMALEAWNRGAEVTLVMARSAQHDYIIPRGITVKIFETYDDAREIILKEVRDVDIFIHAAAISDFAPVRKFDHKVASDKGFLLELRPTEKILELAREENKDAYIIAFKAEWNVSKNDLVNKAASYIDKAVANAVVANDVSKGIFGADVTEVYLVYRSDTGLKVKEMKGNKRDVSGRILDELFRLE